jgi:hypothetical protein
LFVHQPIKYYFSPEKNIGNGSKVRKESSIVWFKYIILEMLCSRDFLLLKSQRFFIGEISKRECENLFHSCSLVNKISLFMKKKKIKFFLWRRKKLKYWQIFYKPSDTWVKGKSRSVQRGRDALNGLSWFSECRNS